MQMALKMLLNEINPNDKKTKVSEINPNSLEHGIYYGSG